VAVLLDSETRGSGDRSDHSSRAVAFYVPDNEAGGYKVGGHVLVGRVGNSVQMHAMSRDQDSVYARGHTLDENRKDAQDGRADAHEEARRAARILCERITEGIANGRIVPTPGQMRRMAESGLTPELALEISASMNVRTTSGAAPQRQVSMDGP
jgi:hypothetical protein